MMHTHTGAMDGSLEPSMFVTIPEGFKLPAALKKVADAHDKAFEDWSDAELAQAEAYAAFERAGEDDKALLIAAINAGDPDPGTPTETRTKRACVVAEETARIRTTAYNAAAVALLKALPDHKAALIAQAVDLERGLITEYGAAIDQATQTVAQAERRLRGLGTHLNFLTEHLHLGGEHYIEVDIDPVQFPPAWRTAQTRTAGILDTLEATVVAAPTA